MSTSRRLIAAAALASLLIAPASVAAAADAMASAPQTACPEQVPHTGLAAGAHGGAVDCLAWWDIGLGDGFAATNAPATRAEFAAVLSQKLERTGHPQGQPGETFDDVRGHAHRDAIDHLVGHGVIAGYADGTFRPDQTISRGQMAALLMRVTVDVHELYVPPSTVRFEDVPPGTTHHDSVALLVGAGITQGVTPTTYAPNGEVTRGQLATFSARVLSVVVETLGIPLPGSDAPDVERGHSSSGTDVATPDDPSGNDRDHEYLNGPDAFGSVDFAGHPMCTDSLRSGAFKTWHATGAGAAMLDVDTEHLVRTGFARCVYYGEHDPTQRVIVEQRPASSWTPDPSCHQHRGSRYTTFPDRTPDHIELCTERQDGHVAVVTGAHLYVAVREGWLSSVQAGGLQFSLSLTAAHLEGRAQ